MNERTPGGPAPAAPSGPGQGFQNFDADAVCERCGTVNDDGSLMCRACGQNLREQRMRRLAGAQPSDLPTEKVNRGRLVAGILSAVGLLVVVIAALSIDNIEAGLVSVMSESPVASATEDFWRGPTAPIFEELASNLRDYPTPATDMRAALEDPTAETTYNGRYILLEPGALEVSRVIGEAALRRRGNRVYFVTLLRPTGIEIRGYAVFEEVELEDGSGYVERPVVRSTAAYIAADGRELRGYGLSEPIDTGGHRVIAFASSGDASESDPQFQLFGYRIR
jgi:hypothetical protein